MIRHLLFAAIGIVLLTILMPLTETLYTEIDHLHTKGNYGAFVLLPFLYCSVGLIAWTGYLVGWEFQAARRARR